MKIEGLTYGIAGNIVRHRKTRGNFKSWNDFLKVPGVTPEILENIKKSGKLQ
jgi:DNA uptake protein ComE-like DNA-binding protein